MKREQYVKIKEYLREVIRGTAFENHVMTVGGCVRDELMNVEIKDIDLCVSLPEGGIRFAEWLKQKGLTTKGVTVYPNFGTAMLHLKAFPRVELEFVQTRREKYIDHSCRNPLTAFGSIREDCLRRDLTINALYCNLSTNEIIDITGNGVNVLAMGAFYVAPQMGCDIADAYLGAELGSGYEWWHNFYEFHKLAIDELEAFNYEEYKANGFKVKHLGDYPLKLETKPE